VSAAVRAWQRIVDVQRIGELANPVKDGIARFTDRKRGCCRI
jgi:hypothetical protein